MLYYICIIINIHLYILILFMGNKPLPDWIRTVRTTPGFPVRPGRAWKKPGSPTIGRPKQPFSTGSWTQVASQGR